MYRLSEKNWTNLGTVSFGFIGKVKEAHWGKDYLLYTGNKDKGGFSLTLRSTAYDRHLLDAHSAKFKLTEGKSSMF
jgi:hypothetical protein